MSQPNVVVVMSRCSRDPNRNFGIRMEERTSGCWHATWAFPLQQSVAAREGYDQQSVRGWFGFDDEYPGCPTCESPSVFRCGSCGKLGCWDTRTTTRVRCPWCHTEDDLSGQVTSLQAGA